MQRPYRWVWCFQGVERTMYFDLEDTEKWMWVIKLSAPSLVIVQAAFLVWLSFTPLFIQEVNKWMSLSCGRHSVSCRYNSGYAHRLWSQDVTGKEMPGAVGSQRESFHLCHELPGWGWEERISSQRKHMYTGSEAKECLARQETLRTHGGFQSRLWRPDWMKWRKRSRQ